MKSGVLPLPPGDFKAFLFDCDGTIADSMPLHYLSWLEALERWNCPFPEAQFYAFAGIPTPVIIQMLNEEHGLNMPVELVTEMKEENYFRRLPEIQVVPAVKFHIENPPAGVRIAVVSGSPHESVVKTLEYLGLREHFPVLLGAEDYARGKPAPDPFLRAAELLGVAPADCLVFEDADLGIESARAAGMSWVRVDPRALRGDGS